MTVEGTFADIAPRTASTALPEPRVRALHASDAAFSARVLCGLLSWADERSLPPDELVPGLGERDQAVSFSYQAVHLGFARAHRIHGSTDLGRLTGSRKTVHHLGVLGPAQQAHATLGEAMRFGMRNQLCAGSLLRMTLVEHGQQAAFECHRFFDDDECGTMIDVDHLVTVFNVVSAFCGSPMKVDRVLLAGSDEQLIAPLRRMLGAPIEPGHAVSQLVFGSSLLDTPNPHFDEMTRRFWIQACEKESHGMRFDSPQTMHSVLQSGVERLQSLDQLAAQLRVSRRTVHRLLAREGIDYSALLDKQRLERARSMLSRGDSAETIAEALEFSDGRSFRRAFRRWTGLSPLEYRQVGHGKA